MALSGSKNCYFDSLTTAGRAEKDLDHMPHTFTDIVLWTLTLTYLFELLTLVCRFGMGWEWEGVSAENVGRLTRGIRIHHGFVGLVVALACGVLRGLLPGFWELGVAVGLALVFSDLIHHFCVLWPLVGHHQFHLVYPQDEPAEEA